jgi:hypothetical protein
VYIICFCNLFLTLLSHALLSLLCSVKLKLHGVAKTLHLSELEHSKAHAEIAKVGEEFEHHLDRDLKELEAGQKLLKTLKLTHTTFRQNMTAILDAEMRRARIAIEASSSDSTTAVSILDETEAKLRLNIESACANLFTVQYATVNALVHRLAEGAREAVDRREDLKGEIRHNIHEGMEGGGDGENFEGDDWWKSGGENGGSNQEVEEDDHWAKETEKWHNQTGILLYKVRSMWYIYFSIFVFL